MAKATDKQKKHPVIPKTNKSKTKKRNIEESTEAATLNDIEKKTKKIKVNIINKSIDENKSNTIDNDKNKDNGSTDSEEKSNDGNKINDNISDDLKTDSEEEKSDDEETENSNIDSTSNKIVPLFQAKPQVHDSNSTEPIFEQLPEDANEASMMHTNGYCETLVGFNAKGKNNMLENLSETEIKVLCGWVRKEGF